MSDLRAMLGDRYEATIEKAVDVAVRHTVITSARRKNGGREPTQDEAALESKWFNPAPNSSFRLYLTRETTQILEAVLPDLLAPAWDEGHAAGCTDPYKRYGECGCGPNPYRQEA